MYPRIHLLRFNFRSDSRWPRSLFALPAFIAKDDTRTTRLIKLLQDLVDVALHRAQRYHQLSSDLRVGKPEPDEARDFLLGP